MNIEKINELFRCKYCKGIYLDPVILSCGHKICSKDVENICTEQIDGIQTVTCHICNEKMTVPQKGFLIDKDFSIFSIINDFDGIDFGEKYKKSKQAIENFKNEINHIELLINDPDFYIADYFQRLRREMAMDQLEITKAIEKRYSELIDDLNAFEFKCMAIKRSRCLEKIDSDVRFIKGVLRKFSSEINNNTRVDEKRWDEISFLSDFHTKKLTNVIADLKNDFLSKNTYTFTSGKEYILASLNEMKINSIDSMKHDFGSLEYYEVPIEKFKTISNTQMATFKTPTFKIMDFDWNLCFKNIDGNHLECLITCDLSESNKIIQTTFLLEQEHFGNFEKNKFKIGKHKFRKEAVSTGWLLPFKEIFSNGFYCEKEDKVNMIFFIQIVKIKE